MLQRLSTLFLLVSRVFPVPSHAFTFFWTVITVSSGYCSLLYGERATPKSYKRWVTFELWGLAIRNAQIETTTPKE